MKRMHSVVSDAASFAVYSKSNAAYIWGCTNQITVSVCTSAKAIEGGMIVAWIKILDHQLSSALDRGKR